MLHYNHVEAPPLLLPSKLHPGLHFLAPVMARRYVMEHLMEVNNCSLPEACSIYDVMCPDVRAGIIEQNFPDVEYVLLA